nr:ADP,ATP carrier protein 1, mitochondrial [Ipomoea batatas]
MLQGGEGNRRTHLLKPHIPESNCKQIYVLSINNSIDMPKGLENTYVQRKHRHCQQCGRKDMDYRPGSLKQAVWATYYISFPFGVSVSLISEFVIEQMADISPEPHVAQKVAYQLHLKFKSFSRCSASLADCKDLAFLCMAPAEKDFQAIAIDFLMGGVSAAVALLSRGLFNFKKDPWLLEWFAGNLALGGAAGCFLFTLCCTLWDYAVLVWYDAKLRRREVIAVQWFGLCLIGRPLASDGIAWTLRGFNISCVGFPQGMRVPNALFKGAGEHPPLLLPVLGVLAEIR